MSDTTSTGGVNMALFEVPARAFYDKIGLFKGDVIIVYLAPSGNETSNTTRLVPQDLISYYSKICERKIEFSSSRSESDEELIHINEKDDHSQSTRTLGMMELNEWDARTFDMALQWMYIGNVIPDTDPCQPFEEVKSYVQFFRIAEALKLSGSFKLVEQKLRAALIVAQEKHDDENEDDIFTCNPVFKETLQVAFTNPIKKSVRELLASFLVESYANYLLCPDKTTARTFNDLFKTVECLELEVLRLVGSSLKTISLKKPKNGLSTVLLLCPLADMKFETVKELKVKQLEPKMSKLKSSTK
ncbi:hypothetical protein EYC80_006170 [Monilinia laxa]|uniref:BTB domain-containing protein n=1 Tax=Monilinia laxa TaxID=61186 RepID=A0A5N6KGP8_MONLA|nr:hypothetical protein EYC80_006170 [Monilinia laxa]